MFPCYPQASENSVAKKILQNERLHPILRRMVDLLHVDRLDIDTLLDAVVELMLCSIITACLNMTAVLFTSR